MAPLEHDDDRPGPPDEDDPIADALGAAAAVAARAIVESHGRARHAAVEEFEEVPIERSLHEIVNEAERRTDVRQDVPLAEPAATPFEGLDAVDMEVYLEHPAVAVDAMDAGVPPGADEEPRFEARPEAESAVAPEPEPAPAAEPAPPAPEPEPAREGSLDQKPLRVLLVEGFARRDSGELILRRGAIERRLVIADGEVLHASSSATEDRLIEILLREGRLTTEQYARAQEQVERSGRRAGAILVEKGLIPMRELFPLVRHHYETLIFDSLTWREGTWTFVPGPAETRERILLDVPTPALVFEGIRSRMGAVEAEEVIPWTARPRRTGKGLGSLGGLGLSNAEIALVDGCDGALEVGALAARHGVAKEDLLPLLAGLKELGWIEAGDGAPVAVPAAAAADPDDPDDLTPDQPGAQALDDASALRARLEAKLEQVDEGSYFDILEVSPSSSGYEIRKAYRRLRGTFAVDRFAVPRLADLRSRAEMLLLVLDEAYEILRDPQLREAYGAADADPGLVP